MDDMHHAVDDVTPQALQALVATSAPPLLLDVRERWEWELARLEGAELMPLSEITRESARLPRDRAIVVYCHHGVRSLAAAQYLLAQGLSSVSHLSGGIDRYAREVDPRIPRY